MTFFDAVPSVTAYKLLACSKLQKCLQTSKFFKTLKSFKTSKFFENLHFLKNSSKLQITSNFFKIVQIFFKTSNFWKNSSVLQITSNYWALFALFAFCAFFYTFSMFYKKVHFLPRWVSFFSTNGHSFVKNYKKWSINAIIQKLVFLGRFNAFLRKKIHKMVIFCQKY